MAIKEVKLPEIGEGVNEGELVSWLVKPGDTIEVDQPIAELMTDKATVEVPSPIAGIVKELKFSEGDTITVEAVMIIVDTAGAGATPPPPSAKVSPSTNPAAASSPPASVAAKPGHHREPAANSPPSTARPQPAIGGMTMISPPAALINVLATPSTRRLAREMNIDINQITGSGLAGRVTRDDVLKQQEGEGASGATAAGFATPALYNPSVTFAAGGEEKVPLKGIRKKIAENMQLAKKIIPHFTIMDEANVTALVDLRAQLKPAADKLGLKITYLPFVFKALIATIREFPKFNASIDDAAQQIVYKQYFNIGFAADTPNGLLVPVIKNAEHKTIAQLSGEIIELAQRARDGKLKLEEMKGATFTVTNIGSIGGTYATPIINHPEVAIFGMYKIQERPLRKDGEWASAQFMNFTVTCDHRLIDGAEAARFLSAFIARIENPGRLMLDMI